MEYYCHIALLNTLLSSSLLFFNFGTQILSLFVNWGIRHALLEMHASPFNWVQCCEYTLA